MTFTLLLLALAVSGAGAWISRFWRVWGQVLMVAGGVGLLTILAVEVRQNLLPPPPDIPSRCDLAVSSCLGNYVAGDLAGQNGTVILIFPPRSLMDAHRERGYEEGFVLPMRHAPANLHLKALHLEPEKGKALCGLGAFKRTLEQAPDALAYVSFVGVPADFDTLFSPGQPKLGLFYVFDPQGTANWLGPLKAGEVRAVVLPRPGVTPRDREAAAGRPDAILDQFYLVATPRTANQVVAQLAKNQPSNTLP